MKQLSLALLIALGSTACKLQLQADSNTLVRSSALWCLPTQKCNLQISTTDFEDTFVAESTSDSVIFSHWKSGDKRLCGNSPSPCHLSTRGFDDNEQLLQILASNETFRLVPASYQDINENYPQAHPIQLEHDTYLLGDWRRDRANGDRDTWVFIATRDGEININLHDLNENLDLAVLAPDVSAPLNQTPNPAWTSRNSATAEEDITLDVIAGHPYFIQVEPADAGVEESSYAIHIEVIKESTPIQPPGSLNRNYKLVTLEATQDCSDGGEVAQPALSGLDWDMASNGRRKNRPDRISLSDGRLAQLKFAAVRYDAKSGAYIDRAAYRFNDGSGDTLHWMTTGRFTPDARFAGVEWSWFKARSTGATCATATRITGS